jgi:hypothetical protein
MGDVVESGIEGLGEARQRIVAYVDRLAMRQGIVQAV